jgi:murein DD-endopeptidase MepM/ murein hydrolase activator NlpD
MKRPVLVAASVLALLLAAAGGFALWSSGQPNPAASLEGAPTIVGATPRTLDLVVTAPAGKVDSLEVRLVQGGKEHPLLSEPAIADPGAELKRSIVVDPKALGLAEGSAEIHVFAADDRWRPTQDASARLIHGFEVDLTPPSIEFRAATKYIKHAGTGVAIWRAKGASRSWIRCGSRDFPATEGLSSDPDVRVALFTIPWLDTPSDPIIHAEDAAGNARTSSVPVIFLPVKFTRDTVALKDDFMRRKCGELNPKSTATEGAALLADFLVINQEMRKTNEATIREIGESASQPQPLMTGAFRQQPNSQVFASFPQERDYKLDGRIVDTQWHLGLDLASNAASSVLASNGGRVLFAGDNGIYGNMVILDHGLGLTSLYAHLAEMTVSVGQQVALGESLGRSGMTGLAAGDHIHFAMLVHGTYTHPPDWFDAKYIADRIAGPLLEAGIALPGLSDVTAPTKADQKAARPSKKRRR